MITQGVDLRAYTLKVEQDLHSVEVDAINGYVTEAENFGLLHSQITACDETLESMERLLSGFQADLGNISEEIKYLQGESSSISIKLNNRRKVEEKLAHVIDGVILPKSLVTNICSLEV